MNNWKHCVVNKIFKHTITLCSNTFLSFFIFIYQIADINQNETTPYSMEKKQKTKNKTSLQDKTTPYSMKP